MLYAPRNPRRRAAPSAMGRAGRPVAVRLIGDRADVAAVLAALEAVTTLTDVSDPRPAHRQPGNVRVYATVARRRPISGGGR